VLSDSAARWLLVLHTALGVAAVGAATHLVIWLRGYLRGSYVRHRAVKKFAWISLVLHLCAFLAGNLMYPTYKVEVRAAYLENANAIIEEADVHRGEMDKIAAREKAPTVEPTATSEMVKRAAKAARWFDVKEHWIALGLIASAGLVLMLMFWDPRRDGSALSPIVLGLAVVIAGTVWLGAIVGVLTASYRAV
jgi:cytochrome bd-type quinol oxidase subunit 2